MRGVDFTGLAMIGALAIAGAVGVMIWSRIARAAEGVGVMSWPDAINPASTENVIYGGVNAAVSAAAGREETLGGAIYDFFHAPAFSPAVPVVAPRDWLALSGETFARDDEELGLFTGSYEAPFFGPVRGGRR